MENDFKETFVLKNYNKILKFRINHTNSGIII